MDNQKGGEEQPKGMEGGKHPAWEKRPKKLPFGVSEDRKERGHIPERIWPLLCLSPLAPALPNPGVKPAAQKGEQRDGKKMHGIVLDEQGFQGK